MPNTREKLSEIMADIDCNDEYCKDCEFANDIDGCDRRQKEIIADHLIANGVTVQEWIPVSEPPKKPGEYNVVQKHWLDGHLESKRGKWNGVEWFVDGKESLMVTHWMPLPQPPKGE